MSLKKMLAKATAARPAPEPENREVALNHSLRNGWNAELVRYQEGSSAATVVFRTDDRKEVCVSGFDLEGLGRFMDRGAPALRVPDAPYTAVDFLEAVVSTAVKGDKMDRISGLKARAVVAKMR